MIDDQWYHLCILLPKKFTSISHQLHISFDSDVRGFVTIWISKLTKQNNGFLNDCRKHWSTFVGYELVYIKRNRLDSFYSLFKGLYESKWFCLTKWRGFEISRFRGSKYRTWTIQSWQNGWKWISKELDVRLIVV